MRTLQCGSRCNPISPLEYAGAFWQPHQTRHVHCLDSTSPVRRSDSRCRRLCEARHVNANIGVVHRRSIGMHRKKLIRTSSLGLAVVLALVAGSVQGAAAASGNLLTNGDMEGGTTGWSVFGAGTLASNTSVVHGGTRSLLRTGRTASWNGPAQSVTSVLANGAQLYDERLDADAERHPDGQDHVAGDCQRDDELPHPGTGRGELVRLDAADRHHNRVLDRDIVIRDALRRDGRRHRQLLHRRRFVREQFDGRRCVPFLRRTAGHPPGRSRTRSRAGSRSRTSPTSSTTAGISSTRRPTTRDRPGAR